MKGDFSRLEHDAGAGFTGVLHQQGRVLTDADWNAGAAIESGLRTLLGRDVIGPNLVGVPIEHRNHLLVTAATCDANGVQVTLNPGRGWIDGLPLRIPGDAPLTLAAPWAGPPLQSPQPDAGSVAAGVRDALVVEAWEEAFSAFQDPTRLLEPALGGPDTTERVRVGWRLKLLRLAAGEDCGNLADRLADDFDAKGRLTVTPAPSLAVAGDCPVTLGGGYTGFEHWLYRVEVATPDGAGNARFKWSRFNGGLVGRAVFETATDELVLRANDQMINHSGLTSFWVEILAPGPADAPGEWRAVMTADATLAADGRLALTAIEGSWPGLPTDEAFIRLWDDVRRIDEFPAGAADPFELDQGIRLEFEAPAADNSNYTPGDYWTFEVRAAGVEFDVSAWPSNSPPRGVHYHRAPLAVLNWTGPATVTLVGPPAIHDCRHVFRPLGRLQTCCRYTVGDGLQSFGDFDRIQDAVDALPPEGGDVCVLAGTFVENVLIDADRVRVHGCGVRSRVVSGPADEGGVMQPVFRVPGRSEIAIDGLAIEAGEGGIGVLLGSDEAGNGCRHVSLSRLHLRAGADSAVKALGATDLAIRGCQVLMDDVAGEWAGIFLDADDAIVEHCLVAVDPRRRPGEDVSVDLAALGEVVLTDAAEAVPDVAGYRPLGAGEAAIARAASVSAGRGGIHLAGGCERVRLVDNQVLGGIGHGVTLGSVEQVDDQGNVIGGLIGWVVNRFDPCDPCSPGDVFLPPPGDGEEDTPVFRSAGALYDIRIERNRIEGMGLCGIGVVAFFDLAGQDEMVSVVGCDILGNRIAGCLQRELEPIPVRMRRSMGYGGIALADVEHLRLHDNVVARNGDDPRQPVCGVFVLHGEGLDLSRNRVLHNGGRFGEEREEVNPGPRGGIVVMYAMPGVAALELFGSFRARQDGVPAARIHHNTVSQPLGQALYLGALGPVSVCDNELTSRGVLPLGFLTSPGTVNNQGGGSGVSAGFFASTVFISNLGLSNELYLQTIAGFVNGATADPVEPGSVPTQGDGFVVLPQEGLDDTRLGTWLANGNVMFCNNQVVADLTELEVSFALSSVLIVSLDDVQFSDNQLDASFLIDFLLTNALVLGMSVRVSDNRIKESLVFAFFSVVTLGLFFNHTVDNQCTHCVLALDSPLGGLLPAEKIEHDNMVLFDWFSDNWCGNLTELINGAFGNSG